MHKCGDKGNYGSHRPKSPTSNVYDALEEGLRETIVNRLGANRPVAVEQHGLWHSSSSPTSSISFLEEVTGSVERAERVEVCYITFPKTFQYVYHRLLYKKWKAFGNARSRKQLDGTQFEG